MSTEIITVLITAILGVISFFLIQFYNLVKEINTKVTDILVELGKGQERFRSFEERITWLESKIEKIEQFIYEKP